MDEVRGICRTNLDDYCHEQWPTKFCRCPQVGESVRARSGRSLRVVAITHIESDTGIGDATGPHIVIELHKSVGG